MSDQDRKAAHREEQRNCAVWWHMVSSVWRKQHASTLAEMYALPSYQDSLV